MFYNLQLIIIFLAHSLVIGDSSDKEDHIYLAKLAEQAKRYNDMVSEMKTVVKLNLDSDLTVEERNLLFVAYNNVIGVRQDSWKIVRSIGQKEELKQAHPNTKLLLIKTYREKIEEEMKYICDDGLTILDQILIPNASTGESQVFYYKMKGDFYKYLAEITTGTLRSSSADNALIAYNSALDIAMTELSSTNPIRLGLALNFSVFYYEILNSLERACRMAKNAFDGAIAELDTLSEESYKLSTSIMQQLRDNLTLWLCNMQGSNEDGGEQRADQEQD